MNAIRKLADRLTGVLGHDVDGKPIRKGSIVEPALPPEMVLDRFACPMEVVGKSQDYLRPIQVRSSETQELGLARPEWLRLVDQGRDLDKREWSDIERQTGWRPRKVEPEKEVA